MLNNIFRDKFSFAYDYFSTLLELVKKNERKFPQSLIFEGNDIKSQYIFAHELARVLNCENSGNIDCECINCKWIRSFSHPAVNNVSQIHYKPDGDSTTTMISVKQAKEVSNSLSLSSEYHRFFIFFSSSFCEGVNYPEFEGPGFNPNLGFSIDALNYQTFNVAASNALLKSVEEPPERTTFVFLSRTREEILPTIASRSLVFKLNGLKENLSYSDISGIISIYPDITYQNSFDISENFQKFIKENSIPTETVLNKILEYVKDLMKQNISNKSAFLKMKNDISIINEAVKHSRANMSDKIVLDTLFLRLARGY